MAVKVLIPAALEQYVGRRDTVEVLGRTVGEVVANLAAQYPELRRHLLGPDGHLRSFVNLYVNEEEARYSRHLIMPEVGTEGQKKLKAASVLLIGTGGLGAPLGMYLAAAGVGRIGLVDFDVVDFSNLQRQIIHGTKDVGRPKLQSAADRINDINPFVHLDLFETALRA